MIKSFGDGGVVVTGEHIALYRLLALKSALKMEVFGMKRRGKSAYSIVKAELGFKGNKAKVLQQLTEYIKALNDKEE